MAGASARRRSGEVTRGVILDATAEIITQKGLDGFTISEVARHADVNRALIYHYFRDRENLVVHAIDRIMERSNVPATKLGGEAVAANARAFIAHPEIGRFVFQLLLSGRPLLRLGDRLKENLAHVELLMRQQFPGVEEDPTFAMVILAFSSYAWSFSREELARVLGLSVEEADERFVHELSRVSELGLRELAELAE